jgi:hypothetical protein
LSCVSEVTKGTCESQLDNPGGYPINNGILMPSRCEWDKCTINVHSEPCAITSQGESQTIWVFQFHTTITNVGWTDCVVGGNTLKPGESTQILNLARLGPASGTCYLVAHGGSDRP